MIINIENNLEKGPGNARIFLQARSGAFPMPVYPGTFKPQFIIESPARGEYLGHGQWMQAEVRLEPDTCFIENSVLILEVGPTVVDNLEVLENYRFTLFLEGMEKTGALVCKNIISSPLQGGKTKFGSFEEVSKQPSKLEQSLEPRPEHTGEAVNSYAAPQHDPAFQIPLESECAPPDFSRNSSGSVNFNSAGINGINEQPFALNLQPISREELDELDGLPYPRSCPQAAKSKLIWILPGIALVIILLAGGWYIFSRNGTPLPEVTARTNASENVVSAPAIVGVEDANDADDFEQETPLASNDARNATDNNTGAAALPEVEPRETPDLETLQMAHGILRENPSDDQLRRALSMWPLDTNTADANFLLLEELAQRGDAESMFLLAQFYDPNQTLPAGSIEKDPEQALNWYSQAKAKGWQSSTPALDALKSWLQSAASDGDSEAQRLLDSME